MINIYDYMYVVKYSEDIEAYLIDKGMENFSEEGIKFIAVPKRNPTHFYITTSEPKEANTKEEEFYKIFEDLK